MASTKDVLRKISAVKKTKQITKAMNMVASAKMRGSQMRIERFRPYSDKFYQMLGDLASKSDEGAHPLLERREEIRTVGIILATSDRGLCGSFNINMINKSLRLARAKQAEGKQVKFYCVGKKGRDAIRKLGYELPLAYTDKMNSFDFSLANEIGLTVMDAYLSGELDELHIVFGEFVSMAKQIPTQRQILPIVAQGEGAGKAPEETAAVATEYTYEPDVIGLLAEILPRFIKVQIYRGLLDTSASEHAARMQAMDNATRACEDMIGSLTLLYNKTRQTAITRELMDIVGGAEALKG